MYMDNWRPGGTGWMDLDLIGQLERGSGCICSAYVN
jgi:hypothetical protein